LVADVHDVIAEHLFFVFRLGQQIRQGVSRVENPDGHSFWIDDGNSQQATALDHRPYIVQQLVAPTGDDILGHDGVYPCHAGAAATPAHLSDEVGLGDDADHASLWAADDDQRNMGLGYQFGRLPHRGPGVDDDQALAPVLDACETAQLRVLAAEDNEINRLVLKTLLSQVGIEPVLVVDGVEAVAAWEREHWDLILMDVQMPTMDGIGAIRAIREREAAAGRVRTPIVGLTANTMSHQVAEYLAAGMDDHVAKPIDANRLFEAIAANLASEPGPDGLMDESDSRMWNGLGARTA
jgi:CheY-like chemotaxis protein